MLNWWRLRSLHQQTKPGESRVFFKKITSNITHKISSKETFASSAIDSQNSLTLPPGARVDCFDSWSPCTRRSWGEIWMKEATSGKFFLNWNGVNLAYLFYQIIFHSWIIWYIHARLLPSTPWINYQQRNIIFMVSPWAL